ncbi:MAG: type II secretion system secretin GspD [Halofilum sp. (in: g-proteobacteria)]|nr:type II secretion system secretin GspD [Halofilum sp. (in: g-proteobacteria)]
MTGIRSPLVRRLWLALLFAVAASLVPAPPARAQESPFQLNLKDADLRALIETVSRRTGRNFIVDPRVNARVDVVTSSPITDRELYEIFLAVLSVHGYAAVPAGDVTKIVPTAVAKQDAIPTGPETGGSQMVTRVVTIEHLNAAQLVPILRPLLPGEGHLAAIQATNRLIVTDAADNISRLLRIIDRVDRPIESEVEVVRLQHASAAEVVRILGSLEPSQAQQQAGGGDGARLAADTRTNSVLIRGSREARLRMRTLIANLDTPLERQGNTRVIYLRYANADDLVEILQGVSDAQGDATGGGQDTSPTKGSVVIQADPNTNSLIVTGPPDRLGELEQIVRQLDIRRAQVLVEAIIAELSEDNARELGVQFAVDDSADGNAGVLTSFGGPGSNIVGIAADPTSIGSGLSIGGLDEDGSGTDFAVLIRALSSDANNNILSTPSLVTLDNEEAEIVVGQNVPFVTGQFSSTDTGGSAVNPFQTIERRDVGLTLKVKPQINEGSMLKMEIEQEVSSLASTAQSASDIVTNKRSLKTTVLVEDGQTLVLGGLIDDTVRTRDEKVPLLGDIPLLGALFRYKSSTQVKQNLMVFLHPTILRDPALADFYTGEKYSYLRQQQLQRREQGAELMIDDIPILPELELRYDGATRGPAENSDEPERAGGSR